jgi:predicted DNA-binding WGR domain protein
VKLSPAQRQARFYRLEIWPDLFGGFSLAREYGRIGQPGRLQLDPFPELDTAGEPLPASSAGSSAGAMSRAQADSRIEA